MELNSRVPSGPIEQAWDKARFEMKLVNPANKRKYNVIVVGSGLAGRSAAASLGELGYNVKCFCFQDSARAAPTPSPRRAASTPPKIIRTTATASIASSTTPSRAATSARAKPTSIAWRRSASTSSTNASPRACPSPANTAACWPTAPSAARRFRARFYARGQTGQQLLLGAYQALEAQVDAGKRDHVPAHRDARPGRHRRQRARHRHAQPGHRQNRIACRRRRRPRHRRLRQRLLPFDQRQGLERHGHLARLQARRRCSPIPASRRFIPPAFPFPAIISRS